MKNHRLYLVRSLSLVVIVCAWLLYKGNPSRSESKASPPRPNEVTQPNHASRGESKSASADAPETPKSLVAGGLSLVVVFEDDPSTAPLTPAERSEIIRDFQLVYGHLDQHEMQNITPRLFKIGGTEVTSNLRVHFSGGVRHRPRAHQDSVGFLSGDPDNSQLVIPKVLIDAYKRALEFKVTHSEAFEKLEALLPKLASDKGKALDGISAAEIIWMPPGERSSDKILEHILTQLKSVHIRRPSLLDFRAADDSGEFALKGLPAEALIARTVFLDDSGKPTQYTGLVYVNGQWRVVFATPGT